MVPAHEHTTAKGSGQDSRCSSATSHIGRSNFCEAPRSDISSAAGKAKPSGARTDEAALLLFLLLPLLPLLLLVVVVVAVLLLVVVVAVLVAVPPSLLPALSAAAAPPASRSLNAPACSTATPAVSTAASPSDLHKRERAEQRAEGWSQVMAAKTTTTMTTTTTTTDDEEDDEDDYHDNDKGRRR